MQDRVKFRKIDFKTEIHPTAIVHPWAKIGRGVKISPYSVIGEHVEIGDHCVIGPHVMIEGRTIIGKNNTIHHSASIGGPPQDLRYEGEVTYLQIGDDNVFREFTTINMATTPGSSTRIGSSCYFMAYAHAAHDCVVGDHVILANSVNLGGFVSVGDYAVIGGGAGCHQFCRVGEHAFIGGLSRIEQDVPPFVKCAGHPARVYGINTIGLERRGFTLEKRMMIKSMFNLLYRNDLNVTQVLERLRNGDFEDPERQIVVDFLEGSKRGITK